MYRLFKEKSKFDIEENEQKLRFFMSVVYKNSIQRPIVSTSRSDSSNIKFSERDVVSVDDRYDEDKVAYILKNASACDEIISDIGRMTNRTFVEVVQSIIYEKGLSDSKVYKSANIDRRLFSKIMSNKEYRPSKDTAFAVALALELSYRDAVDLLARAGYAFSHSDKRDIIVEYCFRQGIYDIANVNILLVSLNQKYLGR